MPAPINLLDIYRARQTIAHFARETPLTSVQALTEKTGASVFCKLEALQETGSFKVRGAANKILNLSDDEKARGVVTVSTGNHGRAVAYVARQQGVHAAVCISEEVPQNKVAALKRLSAEVVIHGQSQDDAFARAAELQVQRGMTLIPPFDDAHVIAGQGTIGLELLEQNPELDTVLAPLSGGGLISGIALAVKSANPAIRVIGVSMEHAPVMYLSLQAGHPVQLDEEETLADSLRGGIGLDNKYTFDMVQRYVDEIVLVSEDAIAEAIAFALEELHVVVEGAGAVGIAALLQKQVYQPEGNVAVVLSGGNIDMGLLLAIARRYIK